MATYRGIETTAPKSSVNPADPTSLRGVSAAVPVLIVHGPSPRGINSVPSEPGGTR
jgi:hypothetical protein